MAEREADAIGECAVPQWMYADGIAGSALRSCGPIMDDQIGDSGTERGDAFRRNNVAHAGNAATLRQNFKQTRDDFDAVTTGNAAEVGRVPAVAANADAKGCNAIDRLSAQAHVGGNVVEIERAAAIDRDRDFGGKSLRRASSARAQGANRRRARRHR